MNSGIIFCFINTVGLYCYPNSFNFTTHTIHHFEKSKQTILGKQDKNTNTSNTGLIDELLYQNLARFNVEEEHYCRT